MDSSTRSATPHLDQLDTETRDLLVARHEDCWSRDQPDHPSLEAAARDILASRSRARARRAARAAARNAAASC